MEYEADRIAMALDPVPDEPVRGLGRINHAAILLSMPGQRRLTIVWAGVSLASSLKLYQSRRESQAGGLCSNPGP